MNTCKKSRYFVLMSVVALILLTSSSLAQEQKSIVVSDDLLHHADQLPVALLTNGERRMHLVPVTSNKNGNDRRAIPALGYELKEEDRIMAALQFYGGGMMGLNKNIVWLPHDEDPNTKLILAAALTTVLKHKVNQVEF